MSILNRGDHLSWSHTGNEEDNRNFFTNCVSTFDKFGYIGAKKSTGFDLQTIISELENGYPVMIAGQGIDDEGNADVGHAWLVDGYCSLTDNRPIYPTPSPKHYLHFIWGWYGKSNGFYYYNNQLGGFDTQAQYHEDYETRPWLDKFHNVQAIIYGYRPDPTQSIVKCEEVRLSVP